MTLILGFTFPWGRYHATPWGRGVNEGIPEWPPSGWRIVRALYATYRNRAPELDEHVVMGVLSKLASPPDFALPPHREFHTRHYMPDDDHQEGVKEQLNKVLDPFVVLPPANEVLVRWDVELSESERACLRVLAERLTYLGRAESICAAQVIPDGKQVDYGWIGPTKVGENEATVSVLVPSAPLDLDGLVERPNRLRAKGHIEPPGSVRVDYPKPESVPVRPFKPRIVGAVANAVRYAIWSPAPPSVKAAVALGHVVRQSAMSAFGRASGRRSATLAGKDQSSTPLGTQHAHAHYFAFAADSGPLLTTVVIWAPTGFSEEELVSLTRLSGREVRPGRAIVDFHGCRLALEGYGAIADLAPELAVPSREWISFTPFAPTRHTRSTDQDAFLAAEVQRELEFRLLPPPIKVRRAPGDWLTYRRHRPSGRDTLGQARRAFGLVLEFAEPMPGPIALGDLSHFGLGLFVPKREG
jgi:CRISPR-associated protein Csb2